MAERLPRAVHVVEAADDLVDELAVIDEPASAGDGSAREVAATSLVAQSPDGTAGAALVWPMAHRTTLRLGVPIGPVLILLYTLDMLMYKLLVVMEVGLAAALVALVRPNAKPVETR